jgi:CDP-paratose 2-epimerase
MRGRRSGNEPCPLLEQILSFPTTIRERRGCPLLRIDCNSNTQKTSMRILITGGAGFIGCHTAQRLSVEHQLTVLDNLSRQGSQANWQWLKDARGVNFIEADVRRPQALLEAVKQTRPAVVIHLAAQVAVTTSVTDPRSDFEINALGTFNLLEALRLHAPEAILIYASTNKVYGGMEETGIVLKGQRYQYANLPYGVAEEQPLDFHSPYGCSKGAADQYVRDYARIYGLRTIVFRQSCIFGTRQFGVEDQGWIAWFAIRSVLQKPVTIYGDGRQVRDVLWIDDLVDAYQAAIERADRLQGAVFNMGGGPGNQLSLLETLDLLEQCQGWRLDCSFADWRPGDQRVFLADTRRAQAELGWRARVSPEEGVRRLHAWVGANVHLFEK